MSAGARAVSAFEIEDVFLVDTKCWVNRDFNPTSKFATVSFAHQTSIDSECILQTRLPEGGGDSIYVLRYFVKADIRLLKSEFRPGDSEPGDDDSIAALNFTLAMDYRCPKEALDDQESVGAFARNAHFHAWPYLREEVHAACGRFRIPRLTLPMLKPEQKPTVQQPSAD